MEYLGHVKNSIKNNWCCCCHDDYDDENYISYLVFIVRKNYKKQNGKKSWFHSQFQRSKAEWLTVFQVGGKGNYHIAMAQQGNSCILQDRPEAESNVTLLIGSLHFLPRFIFFLVPTKSRLPDDAIHIQAGLPM